jgi:hypothetical protein
MLWLQIRLANVRNLLEQCLFTRIPGDFVECGVWRGGCMQQQYRQRLQKVAKGHLSTDCLHYFACCTGGSSIFAKAVLKVHGARDRRVILVDSFQGLPKAELKADEDIWSRMDYLKVSQQRVEKNFQRFGLLDSDVVFVQGFFKQSTPRLAMSLRSEGRAIAVLRLDGDMYQSLSDCLYNLYQLVSIGGFIIVDDWSIKVGFSYQCLPC